MTKGAFTHALEVWKRRCGRNWAILISIFAGIATIIGTSYAVSDAWKDLRPYPTKQEAVLLAENIYPRAIEEKRLELVIIQQRIKWLEARKDNLDAIQQQELEGFRRQLIRAENDLTRLSREQAYFELWKKYQ